MVVTEKAEMRIPSAAGSLASSLDGIGGAGKKVDSVLKHGVRRLALRSRHHSR